ncbi:MAG: hypothetical protein PHC88_12110 [Terrimicrobiaceae bacterium]|nr:hypothetical protein [Terrimicrobiaceae bacterium]
MPKQAVDLREIVAVFESRMRLARASEHAVAGRLLEAEALLALPGKQPDTWDEIDLLARIRVRQGKFTEAMQLWKQSLAFPGHDEVVAARVESLNTYAIWQLEKRRKMWLALAIAWAVIIASTLGWLVVRLIVHLIR